MTGSIDPTRAQFDVFKGLPRDTPIQMLNLVRVKALADYPADHPNHGKGMSGADAYAAYGRETRALFGSLGGRQIWAGRPETVVTGPADERWDIAFIAEYPNSATFLAMVTHPEYREWVKHRQAAVEDSRLIRLSPVTPGEGFGE